MQSLLLLLLLTHNVKKTAASDTEKFQQRHSIHLGVINFTLASSRIKSIVQHYCVLKCKIQHSPALHVSSSVGMDSLTLVV